MGRAKLLISLIFGLIVAWLLQPLWQWYLDKFLDAADKVPGGISAEISKVIAMTSPAHGFLLGVAVGLIIALVIGYWPQNVMRVRSAWEWTRAILWLWRCAVFRHKVAAGGCHLSEGQTSHEIDMTSSPVKVWHSEVRWWPRDPVVCNLLTPDLMMIYRHDQSGNAPRIVVSYEVWGRVFFWRMLKHWRKTDYIKRLLQFRDQTKRDRSLPELPEYEP